MKDKKLKYIGLHIKRQEDLDFIQTTSLNSIERAIQIYRLWGTDVTDLLQGLFSSWEQVPDLVGITIRGKLFQIPKIYLEETGIVKKDLLVIPNGLHKQLIFS